MGNQKFFLKLKKFEKLLKKNFLNMPKKEKIEDVITRLLSQAEPIPLLQQELKNVEQNLLTTQQHIQGIEALKKKYDSSKDKAALDVVVKQLAENEQKLADIEHQKKKLQEALSKLTGGKVNGSDDGKRKAKITFDYDGKSKTELTVKAGDIVNILNTDNPEWYEGELNGKIGFFPKTYCEMIKTESSSSSSKSKKGKSVQMGEVAFTYEARTDSELTIKQGTTIKILSTADEEWWQGEREDGKIGYFPATYVKLTETTSSEKSSKKSKKSTLKKDDDEKKKAKRKKKSKPQAKVKHDYDADGENELSIKQGWIIDIISKTNDDWWEGRYKGKIGFFPRNYVDLIEDKKGDENARVMFDYDAAGKNELTIKTGQLIKIVDKANDDWWEGEYDGKIGFFPKAYVELVGTKQSTQSERDAAKSASDKNREKSPHDEKNSKKNEDEEKKIKEQEEKEKAELKKKEEEAAAKKAKEEEEEKAKKEAEEKKKTSRS